MKLVNLSLSAIIISTVAFGNTIDIYIPNAKISDDELEINSKWAKEIFKGRLIYTSGVGFEKDKSVQCFTREGIYRTSENGITLTHTRYRTDLYEHYTYDRQNNLINIVFGDDQCRYKVTVQREVKTGDQWEKSKPAK